MDTATADQTHKQRKLAGQALSALLGRERLHVRAPDRDRDTLVLYVGSCWDLHGPVGCCTCCPRGVSRDVPV